MRGKREASLTEESTAAGKLRVVLVTYRRKVLDEECDEVVLPGRLGYFGVLPGHTPLLSTLRVGELVYRVGHRLYFVALSWGFCEVADDVVTVLAEFAETPEEIDLEAAEREAAEAVEAMRTATNREFKMAEIKLEHALARIQVARRPS